MGGRASTGAEALAAAMAGDEGVSAPESAPQEGDSPRGGATVENQHVLIEHARATGAQDGEQPPAFDKPVTAISFKEIAEQAARKVPEQPKAPAREQAQGDPEQAEGEEGGEEGAEPTGGTPTSAPDLVEIDHPEYGRIYVPRERVTEVVRQAYSGTKQPEPNRQQPTQNPYDAQRAQIAQRMRVVEQNQELSAIEREAVLGRLEVQLLRIDQQEQRWLADTRYREFQERESAQAGVREVEQAMAGYADVFDAGKAGKHIAAFAERMLVSELNNPANDKLSEAQIAHNVAREMRDFLKTQGAQKREVIKEYIAGKRVTGTPAPVPSKKGGQKARDTGPVPDLRSGLGRSKILQALGGGQ